MTHVRRWPLMLTVALAASLAACAPRERVILLPAEDGGDPGGVALIKPAGEKPVWWTTPYVEQSFRNGASSGKQALQVRELVTDFGPLLKALPPAPTSYLLYFETDTADLIPASLPTLERLLEDARTRAGADVQATGHTDTIGDQLENDELSARRAAEVRRLLLDRGLAPTQVRAVGRGERDLLVPTGDNVDEQRNRRVEVIVR